MGERKGNQDEMDVGIVHSFGLPNLKRPSKPSNEKLLTVSIETGLQRFRIELNVMSTIRTLSFSFNSNQCPPKTKNLFYVLAFTPNRLSAFRKENFSKSSPTINPLFSISSTNFNPFSLAENG
jgi:hypothetical protein